MNWRTVLGFEKHETVTLPEARMMYTARLYERFPDPDEPARQARLTQAMAEAEQELA